MAYSVKAQVGGKLAQVGSRLIDGVAKKVADEFFAAFSARVAPAATVPAARAEVGSPKRDLWLWVALGVTVILAAIGIFVLLGG